MEGAPKAVPMGKSDNYLERDSEAAKARPAERLGIPDLYDSEIRMRIGEMIARAMQQTNKKREP